MLFAILWIHGIIASLKRVFLKKAFSSAYRVFTEHFIDFFWRKLCYACGVHL